MPDLDIQVGYSLRLQGSEEGNIRIGLFEPREGDPKITVQRIDIEDFVLGVFQFLSPERARALAQRIALAHVPKPRRPKARRSA